MEAGTRSAARRQDMFRALRHTYVSVRLEAGESLVSLSKWLGHSLAEITLDHYVPFMPGAGRRAKSLLAGWIKNLPLSSQVKDVIASGASMNVKYKETARGGLAVNIIEC